QKLRSVEKV
ncbi:hypothetical protein J1605_011722, partial [Eschrichtius robustus]